MPRVGGREKKKMIFQRILLMRAEITHDGVGLFVCSSGFVNVLMHVGVHDTPRYILHSVRKTKQEGRK